MIVLRLMHCKNEAVDSARPSEPMEAAPQERHEFSLNDPCLLQEADRSPQELVADCREKPLPRAGLWSPDGEASFSGIPFVCSSSSCYISLDSRFE